MPDSPAAQLAAIAIAVRELPSINHADVLRARTADIADQLQANRTVRFRMLSRDPAAVQAIGVGPMPEHERAVERWLDQQSGKTTA